MNVLRLDSSHRTKPRFIPSTSWSNQTSSVEMQPSSGFECPAPSVQLLTDWKESNQNRAWSPKQLEHGNWNIWNWHTIINIGKYEHHKQSLNMCSSFVPGQQIETLESVSLVLGHLLVCACFACWGSSVLPPLSVPTLIAGIAIFCPPRHQEHGCSCYCCCCCFYY